MENLNSFIQDDSGSPMQIGEGQHWTQIRIVSWGIGCGKPFYLGVYTRVNKVRDWIDRIESWGIGCGKPFYLGVYTRVTEVRDWIDRIVSI